MSQVSRRRFVQYAGGSLSALLCAPLTRHARAQALAASTSAPDLIVVNARVYTVDANLPQAEAFAVKDSRFLAVGSTAEVRNLARQGTTIFDAQQMTIVPGFIDCHNHAGGETLLYDVLVGDPFEVKFVTIDSIIDKLSKRASQLPPGTWVEGYFFDDTKLTDKRSLNVHDLDKVSTQHPVVVHHRGGHTSFYNTYALQSAGLNADSANPPGGTFDRDDRGELNGRVTDNARVVFAKVGTKPQYSAAVKAQRSRDGAAYMSRQFVRYGLTSVHHQGGDLMALQQIRARGDLKHRVSYEATGAVLDGMIANGIETRFGDEWLRFGATMEHTVDGSFSERTMALSVPYPGRHDGYRGNITEPQPALNEWAERVLRAGIQPNCHANGDVAIDMVLTAYERALQLVPAKDVRPKITHCTLINDGLLRRIKAIDVVPAVFSTYPYYNPDRFPFLRPGDDASLHGVPLVPRCRCSCGGRIRLLTRTVCALDGDTGDGYPHGLERTDLGREPAGERR